MDVLIASFQKERERVAGGERRGEKERGTFVFIFRNVCT